jgi:hypothetical protein
METKVSGNHSGFHGLIRSLALLCPTVHGLWLPFMVPDHGCGTPWFDRCGVADGALAHQLLCFSSTEHGEGRTIWLIDRSDLFVQPGIICHRILMYCISHFILELRNLTYLNQGKL